MRVIRTLIPVGGSIYSVGSIDGQLMPFLKRQRFGYLHSEMRVHSFMNRSVLTVTLALCALVQSASPAPAADVPEPMSDGDGPPINLTCVGLTVPSAVHVSALVPHAEDLPGGAGEARRPQSDVSPLSHYYMWDFGDPDGRYNQLPGWNAAHVYDKPGKYTITLTVTDERGKATRRTTWVRVAPDNRRRIYCSLQGNDQLDGASPTRPVRSAARAIQIGRVDCDILFRRGDTFPISRPVNFEGHNVRLGVYDDPSFPAPSPPVLRKVDGPAKQPAILQVSAKSTEVFVDGLEFDSMYDLKQFGPEKVPARGIDPAGINFCVRDCSFRNLSDGINAELKPTGLLVLDCKFSNEIRGYGIYGDGSDHAYVGNMMLNSRQEHLIRVTEPGVTRLLIAHNDLYRPTNGKGSIELRNANWFYISDNIIDGGTLRVGPQEQDKNQYKNWASIKCTWGVVQNNRLDNIFINVRLGTEHVVYRNNYIHQKGDKEGDWAFFLACDKEGFDSVRKIDDVRIEHNTAVNDGKIGQFLVVQAQESQPIGLILRNNLFVAPNLRRGGDRGWSVFLFEKEVAGFKEISGNVWPAGPAALHHWNKADHSPEEWAQLPMVSHERYENVVLDDDGNPPPGLNAGAILPKKDASKHGAGTGPWDELPRREQVAPAPVRPAGAKPAS